MTKDHYKRVRKLQLDYLENNKETLEKILSDPNISDEKKRNIKAAVQAIIEGDVAINYHMI